MFAWAPLPPALAHLGSLEFSKQLLTEAKVAAAPGVGYGEKGEGYVRIAMVENEQRLRQAARNVKRYLQSMGVNTPTPRTGCAHVPVKGCRKPSAPEGEGHKLEGARQHRHLRVELLLPRQTPARAFERRTRGEAGE